MDAVPPGGKDLPPLPCVDEGLAGHVAFGCEVLVGNVLQRFATGPFDFEDDARLFSCHVLGFAQPEPISRFAERACLVRSRTTRRPCVFRPARIACAQASVKVTGISRNEVYPPPTELAAAGDLGAAKSFQPNALTSSRGLGRWATVRSPGFGATLARFSAVK